MKKCKECQSEIDSKAKRCPHCRADQRSFVGRHPFLTIFLVLIVLPIFVTLSFSSGSSTSADNDKNTPQATRDERPLVGAVRVDQGILKIKNEESESWERCYFTLNSNYRYPSNAPSTVMEPILAGEEIEIASGDFTLKNGSRFNIYQMKPNDVSMSCGTRFGFWQFN